MKKVTKKESVIKYVFMCFVFIVLLITGVIIIIKGFNNYETKEITYTQDCDLDYNVYLKPNSYFDSDVLGKGQTYITSLVNYIEAFYNYRIVFSEPVSGDYTYYITATMKAKKDYKDYWTKEYTLVDRQNGVFEDNNTLTLSQTLPIDYNKYNDLMNQFKKEFNLGTDGDLEVVLHLSANVRNDNISPTNITSSVKMNVPLSEQAIEATITTNNMNGTKAIQSVEEIDNPSYFTFKLCGSLIVLASLIGIIIHVRNIIQVSDSNNAYEKSIKSILSGYDSIIVKTDHLLDFSNLNIIKVTNFNDLIDVHNEIRMPINFFEDKRNEQALFLLINNDMAWIYILQAAKLDKKIKI